MSAPVVTAYNPAQWQAGAPGAPYQPPPTQGQNYWDVILGGALYGLGSALGITGSGGGQKNYAPYPEAPTQTQVADAFEAQTGVKCKRRRRRKQLLTQSDKADIAFIKGTLGSGQVASAAIAALLSRRV